MRALVLILACVVMLATIQAAYSSIEHATKRAAESERRKLLKHHRNHEKSHHEKHHNKDHGAFTESLNGIQDLHQSSSFTDTNSVISHKVGSKHHRYNNSPSIDFNTDISSTPKSYTEHKSGYQHGDVVNDVNENHQSKLRIRVERIEHPYVGNKPGTNKGHKFNSKYDRAYIEDGKKEYHFNKARTRNNKWHSKDDKTNRKGSEYKHRSNVSTKASCATDDDCNGGCCIQLKNGKSKCKMPNFRDVGEKCASTCVCKSGLQCFVNTFRRNGQKRIIKQGKRTVGHCMAQNMADLTKGYFLPFNKETML